ncbi:MAG: hypothetical protein WC498_04350 [Candidatus Saccharimonadales bacterium]
MAKQPMMSAPAKVAQDQSDKVMVPGLPSHLLDWLGTRGKVYLLHPAGYLVFRVFGLNESKGSRYVILKEFKYDDDAPALVVRKLTYKRYQNKLETLVAKKTPMSLGSLIAEG